MLYPRGLVSVAFFALFHRGQGGGVRKAPPMSLGGVRNRGSHPHCSVAVCPAVDWEVGVTSASHISEYVLLRQDDVC